MVGTVKIIVKKDEATPFLRKLPEKVNVHGNISVWNMSQKGAKFIRESAFNSGIRSYTGHLMSKNGIQARKLGKNRFGIFIPHYGKKLDRMPPHFVSLKRGRGITRWARAKGITGKSIFVKPHPFIENGWRQFLNSIPTELEQMINKILR